MDNKIEQIAEQNGMTVEFVTWFFNEKKSACGEHWFLALGAMWEGWKGCSAESTAALATIEKLREITGCPAGAGLQDHLRKLAAERDASLNAERVWEKTMMEVCGEDGPASVANEIRALRGLRDTALAALMAQVEHLAAENVGLRETIDAVRGVADNSSGIAGYHLNGDIAKWSDILPEIDDLETPATNAAIAGIKADAAAPLVSALKVIANSEQHNGDTVVCDFDTLISVAACALREYFAKQLREGAK